MAQRKQRANSEDTTVPPHPPRRQGPARLGPRPLPLHLAVVVASWASSSAALPFLKAGWPLWKPELRAAGTALQQSLASVDADSFRRAVNAELNRRTGDFLKGVLAYRHHPYRRSPIDPPEVWREGTTSLLDYGAIPGKDKDARAPVLVVPSLINRFYILDLSERLSLMRYLAGRGLHLFMVNWDRPGPVERTFTLTDYIAGRLETALDRVVALTGRKPIVLGYCMGGLLALALAQRRSREVAGLALLATPWDFHADQSGTLTAMPAVAHACSLAIEAMGELPVDILQTLFAGLDPYLAFRKFRTFGRLDPASLRAGLFVALEDWLNDGVALPAAVARECLFGWYGGNTTRAGHWRVAGRPIDPRKITCPSLVVVPAQDRIVPPASAEALTGLLACVTVHRPPLGHIGMIVSSGAERQAWRPLAAWLDDVAKAGAKRPGKSPRRRTPEVSRRPL